MSENTDRDFPSELLNASKKERLDYYDNYTMAHPLLDKAFKALKPLIRHCGETKLILIVGPTGVGKTKLKQLAEKWIIEELWKSIQTNPGYIAVASVEAVLMASGLFNAKDHLKRSLYALHEPEIFIKNKINYKTDSVYRTEDGSLAIKSRILESELGQALEQALKHRHPQIFFIDEAHHMLAFTSGRKLAEVPEAIKSLANRTGVLHGLVGTYRMLDLHDIGDQLSRRSIYIHLPRYDAKYREDIEDWQSIIWNFQTQIPIQEEPDFESHWEYLYARSLGCVGILKNWTRNAFADAMEEDAKTVTLKHLEQRALSVGQCKNILQKIKEGEGRYAQIEGDYNELRNALGLDQESISRKKKAPQSNQNNSEAKADSPSRKKKNVGLRKPTRDPIGIDRDAG
ncbi:MAG: AAA family ATPase [Cyanobacteria bacterium J06621_8]